MKTTLVFLIASIIQLARTSCPDGFDLIRDGECRGQLETISTDRYDQALQTVIDKCAALDGKPPIIHNEEHEQYWAARSPGTDYNYLVLGLVCNVISNRWEWSDGSPLDYRTPGGGHNPELDKECITGQTWMIFPNGYWGYGDRYMSTTNVYIYCTTQLEQPKGDGCDSPGDDDADDGICYEVTSNALTWQDAQTTCRDRGANMASIHNLQENSFVRRLAVSQGATNGLYIGATIAGKGDQFGWVDGSVWDYENFYDGFPMSGAGDCLAMDTLSTSGHWLNTQCAGAFPVACARPAEPRPTCKPGPWKEGEVIYSPGFPYDASTPCDYFLTVSPGKRVQVEIITLEANSCCDRLLLEDDILGGNIVANLTGEVSEKTFTTISSNLMRVSWVPNGGVNVRGMMMTFYDLVYSSCPDGFDLVRDGECRGHLKTISSSFAQAGNNTVIECAAIGGQPVIIHDEEHQAYWEKFVPDTHHGGHDMYRLILGLICNTDSKRWMWADGSAVDYKPTGGRHGYDPALDQECKVGYSWKIDDLTGSWMIGNSNSMYTVEVYCTTQLQQPTGDGCTDFVDDAEDGLCYQIAPLARTWNDAKSTCANFDSTPVSIHNQQENVFIRKLAVNSGAVNGVYIGAKGTGNQFHWIDLSPWDYKNFYPGFPIAGRGDCLAMDTFSNSGEWMNMDCNSKLAIACSRKATPRPKCSSGPWKEGDVILSPGFPYDASEPCDYFLTVDDGKRVQVEVELLEANTCCDQLVLEDNILGGKLVANLTGEISSKKYTTDSSNFMRVSWQPNGGVNVRGMKITFRAV